jgi:chemotaxis protein methyltransferase CheR
MHPERPPDVPIAWLDNAIRPPSERDFVHFQAFVYKQTGIWLGPAKKALLVGRLTKRVRARGLDTFSAYYREVVEGEDREEQRRMIEAICTHETHFFRDPRQFDFLETHVCPEWERRERPRQIRVWSAGCSSGEEPFTIAMVLLMRLPPSSGWAIDIVATDFSTRALEKARAATWPIEKAHEIPQRYLKAFMLKGRHTQAGQMKAGAEIRSIVRFEEHNLSGNRPPSGGPFDIVLCRNVLIYFNAASRRGAVEHLLGQLAHGGLLFLGHAETLAGLNDRVRSLGPTVYGLIDDHQAPLLRGAPAPGAAPRPGSR